jgi:alkaline phosphatase D
VLDGRGRRDYGRKAARVLGTAQLERFEAWLASQDAEVLFVVSAVPIVHARSFILNTFDLNFLGIADDFRDEWEHDSNWEERNRLLALVFEWADRKGRRAVFLSGDVHIGASFRLSHPRYPRATRVYQLTSSAITHPLSGVSRQLLQLAVAKEGTLGDREPQGKRYRFKVLQTFRWNNFGIVRVAPGPGEVGVTYDLYGSSEPGAITKLNQLALDGRDPS